MEPIFVERCYLPSASVMGDSRSHLSRGDASRDNYRLQIGDGSDSRLFVDEFIGF